MLLVRTAEAHCTVLPENVTGVQEERSGNVL